MRLKRLIAVLLAGMVMGFSAQHAGAQVAPPAPAVVYFSIYKRTTVTPTQYVWFGPNPTVANCLVDQAAITSAAAGVGSIAWGYIPVMLCYPVTTWTAP